MVYIFTCRFGGGGEGWLLPSLRLASRGGEGLILLCGLASAGIANVCNCDVPERLAGWGYEYG